MNLKLYYSKLLILNLYLIIIFKLFFINIILLNSKFISNTLFYFLIIKMKINNIKL